VCSSDLPAADRKDAGLARLTSRQRQILALVAQGFNNEAIADRLGLAEKSVVNHLTAIYQHLAISPQENSRVKATLIFLQESDG
jgi:DNA-binding NarL/FixJ family response regulator